MQRSKTPFPKNLYIVTFLSLKLLGQNLSKDFWETLKTNAAT